MHGAVEMQVVHFCPFSFHFSFSVLSVFFISEARWYAECIPCLLLRHDGVWALGHELVLWRDGNQESRQALPITLLYFPIFFGMRDIHIGDVGRTKFWSRCCSALFFSTASPRHVLFSYSYRSSSACEFCKTRSTVSILTKLSEQFRTHKHEHVWSFPCGAIAGHKLSNFKKLCIILSAECWQADLPCTPVVPSMNVFFWLQWVTLQVLSSSFVTCTLYRFEQSDKHTGHTGTKQHDRRASGLGEN